MTEIGRLLEGMARCEPGRVRTLGEAAREEAERLARTAPHSLGGLFHSLRQGARRDRRFLPWALWAEGTAEQLRGRPAAAAPLFRRSGVLFRRRGDEHTAARVDILMMDALACLGRHRAASRRGRRALESFVASGDRPRIASALIMLGGLADARDQVRAAISLWRRAARLVEPTDLTRRAAVRGYLAGAMQALGRFREAAELYAEVELLLQEQEAGATALQALLGRAEISALLGEVGEAMADIRRASEVAVEIEDDNVQFEAALLMTELELRLGQVDRAAAIAEATIPRCECSGRRDDAARLAALRAVAVARGADGDLGEAVERADQALRAAGLGAAAAVMRVELARAGVKVPWRQLNRDAGLLGRSGLAIQSDLARLAAAEAMAADGRQAQARRVCEQVLAHRHASVWPRMEARRVMAEVVAEEAPAQAVKHLRLAVRAAESVRGRLSSEADRTAFTTRATAAYERLVELLLERSTPRSRREAFDLVARLKSRGLLEALDRKRGAEWKDSPELVRQWNSKRKELAAMLASLESRRDPHSRYATTVVEDRIRSFARDIEDMELDISRATPGLAALLGRAPEPSLRALLTAEETLLEVFFLGPDMVLFHLDGGGLRVQVRRGLREAVEREVEAIRFQLAKAAYGRVHLETVSGFLVGRLRSRLAALGELVLGPLAERSTPGQVFFAPHGVLHHLPLAALELGGQPIVEACSVAVVPGSRVLSRILAEPCRRPARMGVAGFGSAALPEIEGEVRTIARRFPSASTTARAGVADVRGLLSSCDAVHIASHGAFQPLFPAGSGIHLQDGWLTALDLLQMPIRARLVTMGVCASGQVSVAPGEELGGVVRALLVSGVRSAVLAPGVLDDGIGREAAQRFYDLVFVHGPGEALRQVHRELRSDHPHPALWAALQLHGNPRPWEDV